MKTRTALFLGLAMVNVWTAIPHHKIIYFVSPPRSLSTAFMRMMQARGDFCIMHEPSQLVFNLKYSPQVAKEWYIPSACHTYEEVKSAILKEAEKRPVFVKDMSFVAEDFMSADQSLMQMPNVYFVFLLRNPHHSIISLYKKLEADFDQFLHQMSDVAGYKVSYHLFTLLKQHAVLSPYIICTEDLYTNPEDTLRKFCAYVGIEYKPEALQWQDLGDNFEGRDEWHEIKYKESIYHWNGDAVRSTGFHIPRIYAIDEQGNPTFTEITNAAHQIFCQQLYEEQLRYYRLLLQENNA